MKLLVLMLASLAAHAAPATLLEGVRSPGYVANPVMKTFRLTDDGHLSLTEKNLRDGSTTITSLGEFTKAGVHEVMAEIGTVGQDAKLIDPNPSAPLCEDMPGEVVAVYPNGVRKVISRQANCHRAELEGQEARKLSGMALLLLGD